MLFSKQHVLYLFEEIILLSTTLLLVYHFDYTGGFDDFIHIVLCTIPRGHERNDGGSVGLNKLPLALDFQFTQRRYNGMVKVFIAYELATRLLQYLSHS